MFDCYDGVAFDLGYIYFLLLYSSDFTGPTILDRPHFRFEIPEQTGPHRFDALVRLPDHLAGTLADLNLQTLIPTHEKFLPMLQHVFTDSPNNLVFELLCDRDVLTTRRLAFKS